MTKSLRILHTEASCGWGGQEIRILEEMRGMATRGHQVSLLCPDEAAILGRAAERGLQAAALPIGRKRPIGVVALRRWLLANPVDVINTHSSTDSWLAALACGTLAAPPPIVRTRHISAAVPDNATTRWLYKRAAAHVVTTGEKLREQLIQDIRIAPSHISSVPTGIDTMRFAPGDRLAARRELGLTTNTPWIGIVATLRSWKGHLYLADALARLDRSNVRLAIVGEGPMREPLERHIAGLGIGARTLLAGEQRAPEMWMRALDVFCLPSYANEGVPQALVQAMLCGVPVVTTPVGAITEAVRHDYSGLIVAPRDANGLAVAIARLLDDDALAAKLAANARSDAAARFGFDGMIDGMETIFRRVVAARQR